MAEDKQKGLEIVIDDGSRKIPIRNIEGDEIGVFYFRPTDFAILQRYNKAMASMSEIVAPLENVNINADGTAGENDEFALEAYEEAQKKLYEACDYIFGGNLSEAFFGAMHPFSPVGGRFYCESVLERVGEFIFSQFEAETKRINQRTEKYTKKYTKGRKK